MGRACLSWLLLGVLVGCTGSIVESSLADGSQNAKSDAEVGGGTGNNMMGGNTGGSQPANGGSSGASTGSTAMDGAVSMPMDGSLDQDATLELDGGASSIDSGSAPMDGGGAVIDSGTPPMDSSTPTMDSGNTPVDSGTGAIDSGTGPKDSGQPVVDSGQPVVDSGSGTVVEFGLDTRPDNTSCIAPARPSIGNGVKLVNALGSVTFSKPTGIYQAPGDTTNLYVIEQAGAVKRVPIKSNATAADVKTVFTQSLGYALDDYDERGLLGLAFHPDFASNGYVFISYVGRADNQDTSFVDRLTIPTSNTVSSWGTPARLNILKLTQPAFNHNGGHLLFDANGLLFMGFGDGGGAGDTENRTQDLNQWFGKMLRIDVDHGSPYSIPDGNPFKSGGGAAEIYAWGFRNPWRYSFDRETGELWVGDVGQNCTEEVDIVEPGKNYGWNDKEGHYCFNKSNFNTCGSTSCSFPGTVDPVFDYMHWGVTGANEPYIGQSITGGFVYRGSAIAALRGTYLYGDYGNDKLFGLRKTSAGYEPMVLANAAGISTFAEDSAGEIYLAYYDAGTIMKLVSSDTPVSDPTPKLLSQTGCVDAQDPTKMAAAMVPYDINVSFWSDGADKERYLALPNGTSLSVNAQGEMELPPGAVTVKTFWLAGKRVETRFFVRYADGTYGGYTYAWNDAQTDAVLLDTSLTKTVGNQSWYFPARGECNRCHTEAVKGSIGLETIQLDRVARYPGNKLADQLDTLKHIGFLAANVASPAQPLPAMDDTSTALETRARAYLHANCANCHRPGGPGLGQADFRFWVTDPKVCNVDAQEGTLGVSGAKLLVPGEPDKSLVYMRMSRRSAGKMPPLASSVVDAEGQALLQQWITDKSSCP